MTAELRDDLLDRLTVLGMHYPAMRYGQLVAFAAAMAGDGTAAVPEHTADDVLLAAIDRHLTEHFGAGTDLGSRNGFSALTEARGRLVDVLQDLGRRFPGCPTGRLLAGLAALAHVSVYDAEDEQLVQAAGTAAARVGWFDWYVERLDKHSTLAGPKDTPAYRCPCCRHRTLYERGGFEICPVCYWEDDGQDDADAATVRGGPNGALSLSRARENYAACGVCDLRFREHVRAPRPEEI